MLLATKSKLWNICQQILQVTPLSQISILVSLFVVYFDENFDHNSELTRHIIFSFYHTPISYHLDSKSDTEIRLGTASLKMTRFTSHRKQSNILSS